VTFTTEPPGKPGGYFFAGTMSAGRLPCRLRAFSHAANLPHARANKKESRAPGAALSF